MRSRFYKRVLVFMLLLGAGSGLLDYSGPGSVVANPAPLGLHCGNVSPIDDWCGCTWGAVFYQGRPIAGAQVTIDYGGESVSANTLSDIQECFPYYGLNGAHLGLSRLDVFTVTATYAGRSVSRVVRAVPDESGEQQVNLILDESPTAPEWSHYAESELVRSIVLRADALWSGGDHGVTRHQQPYGCPTSFGDAVLPTQQIRALADTEHSLWVGTPNGVSEYDGAAWVTHSPGLDSTNIEALAVHPITGDLYAGANASSDGSVDGGISRYDGVWQPLPDFNGSRLNHVQALEVDSAGRLWVGTDSGVSRCDAAAGTSCITYNTDDGLGSNNVLDIAEASDGDIWVATWSYVSAQGIRGGASRYDTQQGSWTWYTPHDGLAGWDLSSVIVDGLGRIWFGTWGGGISRLEGGTWRTFTTSHGLPSNNVRSLTLAEDGTVWAGTDAGLYRFPDSALASLETAFINSVTPSPAVQGIDVIAFSGAVSDDGDIVGYEWRSDLDGVLNATRSFALEASGLSTGTHQIQFRVQNRTGTWSASATTTLIVEEGSSVYLPLVLCR